MRLFIYIGFIKKILSYRFVLYFEIIHFFVSKQFNSKLIKFVNLPKVLMYRISTVSKSCASLVDSLGIMDHVNFIRKWRINIGYSH